jgi:MFS transporter, SP family, general alpha glucoside:H+ symporter
MATDAKDTDVPVEIRKLSIQQDVAEEAREATEAEHMLSFKDAVRYYPKAIAWSMYFSLGVIMLCKCVSLLAPATDTDLPF